MINNFSFFNLLSAKSQNAEHSKLILSLLIAERVLNDRLNSPVHGDGYWVVSFEHPFDHVASVCLQVANGFNVGKIHFVLY